MEHNASTIYRLNPSVDVYKIGDDRLEFYFVTTRQRVIINVSGLLIRFVASIDGISSLNELAIRLGVEAANLQFFVDYLYARHILQDVAQVVSSEGLLAPDDRMRYARQIAFFGSSYSDGGCLTQAKLQSTRVAVLGVGAIGSGIALQLAMAGVRSLVLVDYAYVQAYNVERHYTYAHSDIGKSKVNALADHLLEIDPLLRVECHVAHVSYDTDVDTFVRGCDLVVNTMDEPYIGYTSATVGRRCLALNIPLFVAGGFDAHLMSTGELIIPSKTPCVDCYLSYFSVSLEGWKPRYNVASTPASLGSLKSQDDYEVGGLASMALFSISYAVITILDYLAAPDQAHFYGRGECLFESLKINYLNVPRNPTCPSCGSL